MSTRKFDFARLNEAGKDIKSAASKMETELKSVDTAMKNSKAAFDSDAGEELRQRFNQASAKFDELKKMMDDYGQYLITEAERQKQREMKLKTAAGTIPALQI